MDSGTTYTIALGLVLGLAGLGLVLVMIWRGLGVYRWHRAVRLDIRRLKKESEQAPPARQQAIALILARCDEVYRAFDPRLGSVAAQRDFVREIAACFFPDARQPELMITLGRLLHCLDRSLSRFDQILQRPGIGRLRSLSLHQLRTMYDWALNLLERPAVQWYWTHRQRIMRWSRLRLLILPDPFSWFLFLSQRLAVLVLMKILVVDITLFVGRLALDSYDWEGGQGPSDSDRRVEAALEDLAALDNDRRGELDPRIRQIRKQLIGFPVLMGKAPAWDKWKETLGQSASLIAEKHFPDSSWPLEEAAVGPLLQRTRIWLGTMVKKEESTLFGYIYKTRLELLFQAKDLSDAMLPPGLRFFLRQAFEAYGWMKWPLVVYRWSKAASLPSVALTLGWTIGKKAAIAILCKRGFDTVCKELDMVYRSSARMGRR